MRRLALATAWIAGACAVDNKAFSGDEDSAAATSAGTTGARPDGGGDGPTGESSSPDDTPGTAGSGGIDGTDGDSGNDEAGDTSPTIPPDAPCDIIGRVPDLVACWDFDEVERTVFTDDGPLELELHFGVADVSLTDDAFWGEALSGAPGQTGTVGDIPFSGSWTIEIWFSGRAEWPASLELLALNDDSGGEVIGLKLESPGKANGALAVARFGGSTTEVDLDEGPGRHRCAALVFAQTSEQNTLYVRSPEGMGVSLPVGAMNMPSDAGDRNLILSTGNLAFIDGLRIWSSEVRQPCDPAPPPG
ncbi:MAG: hypothetical protein AAF721_37110 [Myxococcota bacterium]